MRCRSRSPSRSSDRYACTSRARSPSRRFGSRRAESSSPSAASGVSAKPRVDADEPRPVSSPPRRSRHRERRWTSDAIPIVRLHRRPRTGRRTCRCAPREAAAAGSDRARLARCRSDWDTTGHGSIEHVEIALEEQRDLAGVRRPDDEREAHFVIVVPALDAFRTPSGESAQSARNLEPGQTPRVVNPVVRVAALGRRPLSHRLARHFRGAAVAEIGLLRPAAGVRVMRRITAPLPSATSLEHLSHTRIVFLAMFLSLCSLSGCEA